MRLCSECPNSLPEGSTARRRFCSLKCKNRSQAGLRAAYQKANPDKMRVHAARYRKRNTQRIAAHMREYYAANPEVFSAARHRRRLVETADACLVTDLDWRRLLIRFDQCCAYCGERSPLTRDHIIPVSRGGRHSIGNLVPACRRCNGSKGPRLLVEWRRYLMQTTAA